MSASARQVDQLVQQRARQFARSQGRSRPADLLALARSIQAALESLNGLEVSVAAPVAARGSHLLADIFDSLSMTDDAFDAYADAVDLFEQSGGNSQHFGRLLHDFSVFLYAHAIPDLPLVYAQRAQEVFRAIGSRKSRKTDVWVARLSAEGNHDSGSSRPRGLGRFRRRDKAEHAQARAMALLHRPDAKQHAAEIVNAMTIAYQNVAKGDLQGLTTALSSALEMFWQGMAIPDWVIREAMSVAQRTKSAGQHDLTCLALAVAAAAAVQRNRQGEALTLALDAVATSDLYLLGTESEMFRLAGNHIGPMARQIALEIVIQQGEAAQAAELIETASMQVLPDTAAWVAGTDSSRARVTGLRPVAVGGRSVIADFYPPGVSGPPIDLEDVIGQVGGAGAVWWGTWCINERIYWSVRISGQWSCGVLSLSEGTTLRPLLKEAHDGSMSNESADTLDLLRASWSRSSSAEELLALDLGEVLIPPALRELLLDTAGVRPVSLVVSGDLGSLVPLPLLAIGADRYASPLRLVETAVLRTAPPAVLVDRMSHRPSVPADQYPILVACVDPAGNLKNSREVPAGARVVLSGAPEVNLPKPSVVNVMAALETITAGEAGLFYYSGHVDAASFSMSDDAFPLSDGETLSARALFQGERSVAFPARALLSACRSAGTAGGGAGEWLGLTAAVLWLGCRQAVSTNWPIWDLPFTSHFEQALASRLTGAADTAAALRELQIEALTSWRSSEHDLSFHTKNGFPGSTRETAFPLIWAAYCCVGVADVVGQQAGQGG